MKSLYEAGDVLDILALLIQLFKVRRLRRSKNSYKVQEKGCSGGRDDGDVRTEVETGQGRAAVTFSIQVHRSFVLLALILKGENSACMPAPTSLAPMVLPQYDLPTFLASTTF